MTRRKVLVSGSAAVGVTAVVASGAISRQSNPIDAIIDKHLPREIFADGVIDSYKQDLMKHVSGRFKGKKWEIFKSLLHVYSASDVLDKTVISDFVYARESLVVSTLLLSTDFFFRSDRVPAELSKNPVVYRGWYYDQNVSICIGSNPFATFS